MLENININQQDTENDFNVETNIYSNAKQTMNYVLGQIEKITTQTEYLNQAVQKLGEMADGHNADPMSPGNTLGQAKAQAIEEVVRCRETTNQQLLKFYEKMYDDLKPQPQANILRDILSFINELPPTEAQVSLMKIYEDTKPKSNMVTRFDEISNWLKALNKDEFSPEAWLTIQDAVKAQLSRN